MAVPNRLGLAIALVFTSVGATACDFFLGHELNEKFCRAHISDPDCQRAYPDAGPDAPMMCTDNKQCVAPMAICDLGGSMTCVACTPSEARACTGATPACIANQCQKCTAHTQCTTSNACLPDGTCADQALVAYVQAGGTGNACTKTAPCGTLDDGLKTNKPIVKIQLGTMAVADTKTTTIDGRAVTILADPGAQLGRTNGGVILEVKNDNADVGIFDLEITGGTGANSAAISMPFGGAPKLALTRVTVTLNQGLGVSASAGTLTVSQSTISGNTGGGISVGIGAVFSIVGNVLYRNGTAASAAGGVNIQATEATANRLEFNSFNKNVARGGTGAAIECAAGLFTARNNIMSGNGTLTNPEQVGGTCSHTYSIVLPGTLPSGLGNVARDPRFKDTDAIVEDLHIQAGSPAIGAADPNADLSGNAAQDIDGDTRKRPADIGADQIP